MAQNEGERRAHSGAVLGVFGDQEPHAEHLFQHGEDGAALRQLRQVADEHEIADRGVQRGENRALANALQHHVEDAEGGVLRGDGPAHLAKVRGRRVQRQALQRRGGDVADLQIDVLEAAVLGQLDDLADVGRVEQQAGQAGDRAAADADAADVRDLPAGHLHERGAGAHAHHDRLLEIRVIRRAQAVRQEFVRLRGRDAVQRLVDVGAAHAGEHNLFDGVERNPVVIRIFAERAEQRGHRVGRADEERLAHALLPHADNLGGAAAHVDADHKAHGESPSLFPLFLYIIINVSPCFCKHLHPKPVDFASRAQIFAQMKKICLTRSAKNDIVIKHSKNNLISMLV